MVWRLAQQISAEVSAVSIGCLRAWWRERWCRRTEFNLGLLRPWIVREQLLFSERLYSAGATAEALITRVSCLLAREARLRQNTLPASHQLVSSSRFSKRSSLSDSRS